MSNSGRDIALSFIGGFLFAILIFAVIGTLTLQNSDAYGLDHWKLNARMPLATTWINLGYWTNESGDRIQHFNEATAQLLKEILRSAGLLRDPALPDEVQEDVSLAVVDLGFGCGDQTLELIKQIQPKEFTYVGLTLDQAQVTTAYRNIHEGLLTNEHNNSSPESPTQRHNNISPDSFKLFCADASKPQKWNSNIKSALYEIQNGKYNQKWLLALDCLYHFHPSRSPIYTYAATTLRANAMAFDIILNPRASTLQILIVRVICLIMRCPWKAFLTKEEYIAELIRSGYEEKEVLVQDITEHVFLPVADFLEKQERRLAGYGVGIGGYKLAGRIFEWFGRSGVVRGVIVIARVGHDDTNS